MDSGLVKGLACHLQGLVNINAVYEPRSELLVMAVYVDSVGSLLKSYQALYEEFEPWLTWASKVTYLQGLFHTFI